MKKLLIPLFCLPYLIVSTALAQRTWTGSADVDWHVSGNWDSSVPAPGEIARFSSVGLAASGVDTAVITSDVSIGQLQFWRYNSGSTLWHTLRITDATVEVSSASGTGTALLVGAFNGTPDAGFSTQAAITGTGRLVINEASGAIDVYSSRGAITGARLDLSGLAQFEANVANIRVGYGNYSYGALHLAKSSTISAGAVFIGNSNGNLGNSRAEVPRSELWFGTHSALNTDLLAVGATGNTTVRNSSSGYVAFTQPSGSSFILRGGAGGESRARVVIGGTGGIGAGGSQQGEADFRGGSIDARVSELLIAQAVHSGSSVSSQSGIFRMGQGLLDAEQIRIALGEGSGVRAEVVEGLFSQESGEVVTQTLTIAESRSGGQNIKGSVLVSGGSMSVAGANAAGDAIVLGARGEAAQSASVVAELKVSGEGAVHLTGGHLATRDEAQQITSTVELDGGLLDLAGHHVIVDQFVLRSGELRSLGQFDTRQESGASVAKVSSGTLLLSGTHTYTGVTQVEEGTLRLKAGAILQNTASVLVAAGASFGGKGEVHAPLSIAEGGSLLLSADGLLVLDGALTIADGANLSVTFSEAPIPGTTFLLLEQRGTPSITGRFATVNGEAIQPGGQFSLELDGDRYLFALSYSNETGNAGISIVAIPEPSQVMLLLGFGVVAAWFRFQLK